MLKGSHSSLQSLKVQVTGSRTEVRAPRHVPTLSPFPRPTLSSSETLPTDPGHCDGPADRLDLLYFLRHLLSGVGGDRPLKVKGTREEAGGHPHGIVGLPPRR